MISIAAIAFGGSTLVLILLLVLIRKERRQNQRFFATKLRSQLDLLVIEISNWFGKKYAHFIKYVVQLHWYYSLHSFLKTVLKIIVTFYAYFENIFENNRIKAKKLRIEKKHLSQDNHLQQMAEHKEDTSLSSAQKKKLSERELEGKH